MKTVCLWASPTPFVKLQNQEINNTADEPAVAPETLLKQQQGETRMIYTKSLGAMYLAEKKKEKSPDMKGSISIQASHLEQLSQQFNNDGTVVANIAAWQNKDKQGHRFLTIELQPRQQQHQHMKAEPNEPRQKTIFDFIEENDR